MATYAIIYATVSKAIRRVIADDDGLASIGTMPDGVTPAVLCAHTNGQPTSYHPLGAGESAIVHIPPNVTTPAKPADWIAAVLAATGVTPPNITCALIDNTNTVTDVITADPAIDAAPSGRTMVQCYSPLIGVGCTYDSISGLFTIPSYTIPVGNKNNPGSTPLVIPAVLIAKT
jgi:hypothetical protein